MTLRVDTAVLYQSSCGERFASTILDTEARSTRETGHIHESLRRARSARFPKFRRVVVNHLAIEIARSLEGTARTPPRQSHFADSGVLKPEAQCSRSSNGRPWEEENENG